MYKIYLLSDNIGVTAIRALAKSRGYVNDCEVTPANEPARKRRNFVLLRSGSVFTCFLLDIIYISIWMIWMNLRGEYEEQKRMRRTQHIYAMRVEFGDDRTTEVERNSDDGWWPDNVPSVHVNAEKLAPLLVGRKLNGCVRHNARHSGRVAAVQTAETFRLVGDAQEVDDRSKREWFVFTVFGNNKYKGCGVPNGM